MKKKIDWVNIIIFSLAILGCVLGGIVGESKAKVLKNCGVVIVNGTEYQKVLTDKFGYCFIYNNGSELKPMDVISYSDISNP